jgi:hypothetical protein
MDEIHWYQSRTIWSAIISAVAAAVAITGHNIDAGTQVQVVNAVVDFANGVSIVAGLLAAWYRTRATTTIKTNKPPDV